VDTTASNDNAPAATGASHHITRPSQDSAPAPDGNPSEDRTEVVRLVIDTDPGSPDLTVVHVCGRGDQLRQLVRAAVDAARQLGQTVLEIRLVDEREAQ